MKNYQIAIVFTTLYLVMYSLLVFGGGSSVSFLSVLFAVSPILVGWMVYATLRHAVYNGRELNEGEEYGYEDRLV